MTQINFHGAVAALSLILAASCGGGLGSPENAGPSIAARPAAAPANAQAACPACTADPTHYLRQLSLDLRGRPPSMDELTRVAAANGVPDSMIDEMLRSDEFLTQVESWHRALLWPNLDGFHVRGGPIVASDFDDKTSRRIGGQFSPDPTLLEDGPAPKGTLPSKRKPPHGFVFFGDGNIERLLRGSSSQGCDPTLEYPPPSAKALSYAVTGSDNVKRSYRYYDADAVPLPYHDSTHCPNFCSSKSDAERGASDYKQKPEFYAAMREKGPDAKPHELDPLGMHCPASHPHRVLNACTNAVMPNDPENAFRERREGFRRMKHYWSKTTEIRTCAYEAQERESSVYSGSPCAGSTLRDSSCGCGPGGLYCMPAVGFNAPLPSRTEYLIRSALNEEPLRIVSSVIQRNEDYFEIFTTRRSFVTGPLAFLYKNQLPSVQGLELGAPAPKDTLPNVAYDDLAFHEYVRDAEHAGVLTTPAYLGRFPTWRARVSQFRSAFMCRPFTPGSASLPSPDDPCTREPNLGRRCGCKNCHSAIEPMTAYFGRWAERSAKYLSPREFPAFDPYCQQCALTGQGCTPRCRTQYVVDTVDANGARYAGTLRGYLYRAKEEETHIDEGPAGLVASAIVSGELQKCTVRSTWTKLLGRPMSDAEMGSTLDDLVLRFDGSHHSYRELVRAIVTSPAYRRVD